MILNFTFHQSTFYDSTSNQSSKRFVGLTSLNLTFRQYSGPFTIVAVLNLTFRQSNDSKIWCDRLKNYC